MGDDDLILYPTTRFGAPGFLLVSAALLERAPLDALPVAVIAWLALERDPSSSRVDAPEEALVGRIEATGGVFAGHVRNATELLSIGYVPVQPSRVDEWKEGWTDLHFLDDPDWSVLAEFLRPDETEAQSERDLRVWAAMSEQGDDGQQTRPVDHQASFTDDQTAQAFIDDIGTDGFRITDSETNPGHVVVQVTRVDPVEPPPGGISEIVASVRETAERHGGSYIGWGAPIVRARRRWWRRRSKEPPT